MDITEHDVLDTSRGVINQNGAVYGLKKYEGHECLVLVYPKNKPKHSPHYLLQEAITPDITEGKLRIVRIHIFGKAGSGNTTTMKTLVDMIVRGYGNKYWDDEESPFYGKVTTEFVNTPMSDNPTALIESMDDKPVQVLCLDATSHFTKKYIPIIKEKASSANVVILITTSQNYCTCDCDIKIFKSAYKVAGFKTIGLSGRHDLYSKLKETEYQINVIGDHDAKSNVVVSLDGGSFIGEMRLPPPETDFTYSVNITIQ